MIYLLSGALGRPRAPGLLGQPWPPSAACPCFALLRKRNAADTPLFKNAFIRIFFGFLDLLGFGDLLGIFGIFGI